ncbi:MAG: Hsp20 family protein [Sphingomonadales bacterium]
MRGFDFTPLLRSTVGFENLNRLVDMASRFDGAETAYPPYNIEKLGDDDYRIAMAVAGFKRDELDIVVQENTLVIRGQAAEADDAKSYLHRGIAKRAFERRFQLADSIKIVGASLDDGLLNVDLKREVPEHKKPRQIEIQTGGDGAKLVEAKSAA